jgi:hypothetical protein
MKAVKQRVQGVPTVVIGKQVERKALMNGLLGLSGSRNPSYFSLYWSAP